MKFDELVSSVKDKTGQPDADNLTKITISASKDTPVPEAIRELFRQEAERLQIPISITIAGSYGYRDLEPIVRIEKSGISPVLISNVTSEKAAVIAENYLANSGIGEIDDFLDTSALPLFSLQKRVALRNCGLTDPDNIAHSILERQGYSGLDRALAMEQSAVIDEVRRSGLLGKGRACYPVGDKWQVCKDTQKYVLCNGR